MAILPRRVLKSFFEKGDKPNQSQFSTLIDSMLHSSEDHTRLGLRVYDPARSYYAGDAVLYNDVLYLALVDTTGAFNSTHWRKVLAFGSLTYRGMWNAATNNPQLTSGAGTMGDYYIVSVNGNTSLDGNSTWVASDYVIFNGGKWERAVGFGIDNQVAAEVPYNNTSSGIPSTDVQDAIDTVVERIVSSETDITAIAANLSTLSSTVEYSQNKGIANGYAGLGADARIEESFLPQSILGATKFKGFWDADNNKITSSDPAINDGAMPAASSANEGWYFIVTVPGATDIDTITSWGLGDWIISIGTSWKKVDNTDALISFNGRTGVVVPLAGDYTASMVGLGNVPNIDATDRANHTGTQAASTISDFQSAVSANPDVAALSAINITRRHDFVSPYSYCGKAASGSSESASVWTIKRIQVSSAGSTTITTAANVAWVNRYTAAYS